MSDPLTSLVKKIEQKVDEASPKYKPKQRLGAFVMVSDSPGQADRLRGLAECELLKRVNLSIGGATARYEINPQAALTVVVYTPGRPGQQSVAANFALREGKLDEVMINKIIAALAKVLPK
jgi:hypothetical protein